MGQLGDDSALIFSFLLRLFTLSSAFLSLSLPLSTAGLCHLCNYAVTPLHTAARMAVSQSNSSLVHRCRLTSFLPSLPRQTSGWHQERREQVCQGAPWAGREKGNDGLARPPRWILACLGCGRAGAFNGQPTASLTFSLFFVSLSVAPPLRKTVDTATASSYTTEHTFTRPPLAPTTSFALSCPAVCRRH